MNTEHVDTGKNQTQQNKYEQRRSRPKYHMYSAIMLSVNGVMSKLSKSSTLLMVPFSELTAITLNLAERATFLVCFITKELHIFDVIGVAQGEVFVILICHCVEGAKICAIFYLTKKKNQTAFY